MMREQLVSVAMASRTPAARTSSDRSSCGTRRRCLRPGTSPRCRRRRSEPPGPSRSHSSEASVSTTSRRRPRTDAPRPARRSASDRGLRRMTTSRSSSMKAPSIPSTSTSLLLKSPTCRSARVERSRGARSLFTKKAPPPGETMATPSGHVDGLRTNHRRRRRRAPHQPRTFDRDAGERDPIQVPAGTNDDDEHRRSSRKHREHFQPRAPTREQHRRRATGSAVAPTRLRQVAYQPTGERSIANPNAVPSAIRMLMPASTHPITVGMRDGGGARRRWRTTSQQAIRPIASDSGVAMALVVLAMSSAP